MTKAKVADFLVEVLLRAVVLAAVLVLLPVALDTAYSRTEPWPAHQNATSPAGTITLMWLDGWGGVAFPAEPGTTDR